MPPLLRFLRGATPHPNAAPDLRIKLARRLVETQGAPFVESHEVFTDVASALDELGLLPAGQGPTVVWVQVEGSTDEDREALAGDWLVDPDVGERVTRLPEPRWNYDNEAKAWVRGRSWLEAWETCHDARWMLRAARNVGIDRLRIVRAVCVCARTVLHLVPSGEARPLRAIEATERWVRGEATRDEVRDAGNAAASAANDSWSVASSEAEAATAAYAAAAYAARTAFWSIDTADGAATSTVERVAFAMVNATSPCGDISFPSHPQALAHCADLVRSVIPTLMVLRVVATPA